ncbi:MAG: FecR domain-containing protein [Cytophagales bacterium]|nr:FecR domain-containing protein [Cytophagales bacterium]
MESGRKNIRSGLLSKREEKIMQWMTHLSVPAGRGKHKVWEDLERMILSREKKKVKILPMWSKWQVGVAASVILLIAMYAVIQQVSNKIIETSRGEQVAFYLPDSSKVTVNAESKITYNALFWGKSRKIQLEGEAFFEVEEGKKFEVMSRNGSVEVLGTSFNIFARENKYIVNCLTGKVKVNNKDHNDFKILTPGLSTRIENNRLQLISRLKPEKISAWARGEFYFEMTPLEEVIKELERQYDLKISAEKGIDQRLYTGFFYGRADLEKSLDLVFSPMGLKFEIVQPKEIRVFSENM